MSCTMTKTLPKMRCMQARRATSDELLPHIVNFVGLSGGGQWSFQLLCKFCRDLGTISAARYSIHDPTARRKAAEAFAKQGWWIDDIPICPKCHIRKGA